MYISRGSHLAVLQYKKCLNKSCIFSKIYFRTKFQDPTLSSASIAATSEVRTTVILALLMVGNFEA
jgi:hypothetical protein